MYIVANEYFHSLHQGFSCSVAHISQPKKIERQKGTQNYQNAMTIFIKLIYNGTFKSVFSGDFVTTPPPLPPTNNSARVCEQFVALS